MGSYASGWEAVLYEHSNYIGASSAFRGDDADFGNDTINHDRASSIQIRSVQPCPTNTIWKGEYWNNQNLSGNPALCRNDSDINFDWGMDSPGTGVPSDHFSARWTASVSFPSTTRYRFYLAGDDGIRLWIDDALLIDQWHNQGRTEYSAERDLPAGNHNLKVEYYENGGAANVSLRWDLLPPTATVDPNLAYRIVSVNSGKMMDVSGVSQDDGAPVHQWDWWGGPSQQWRFEPRADGYYRIRSVNSNKCLDVAGVSTDNGVTIQQWTCHDGDNQQWQLIVLDGSYVIQAKHSGKVLDVWGGSFDNGARIIQWDRHNGNNQRWRLEPVSV